MLVDTHAHLSFEEFGDEAPEVLARAHAAGVGLVVNVGSGEGIEGSRRAVAFARANEGVVATVGVHPHDAGKVGEEDLNALGALAGEPEVVGIGETGFDYHYDLSPRPRQREVFERQIALARERKLPLVVHTREAWSDTFDLLRAGGSPASGGVFHCFTGGPEEARAALDLGFYVSFSGILTFRNAEALRAAARLVPIERALVETDAPFLAPEPMRGKRNEPAYVVHTAKLLADLKGLSPEDVARVTEHNARSLFRLPEARRGAVVYSIRRSLYLNLTNHCTLACKFCPKFDDWWVKGHSLRVTRDPTVEEVLTEVGDPSAWNEVVFCGLGESTLRLDALEEVARELRKRGARRIRLDTDGLGNLVHGRDILPELVGLVDALSVSLNAADPETYAALCPSKYGEAAYPAVKEFIREAVRLFPDVAASVVAVPPGVPGLPAVDVEACRKIVEEDLGARFKPRTYNEVG